MYAIIPDQRTKLVGVGKWLNVHAEYASVSYTSVVKMMPIILQGDTEVMCAPQELAPVSTRKVTRLFPSFSKRNKTAKRKSERFTRFFRSFSYIEKLVIRHLNSRDAMDRITATLANVRITQLEVTDCDCDEPFQYVLSYIFSKYLQKYRKRIIELTRKHKIRFVTICALRCDLKTLGEFCFNI